MPSSRESREAAGWDCREPGMFRSLLPPDARPFSWLSPMPLIASRNDVLARLFGDPTDEQRRRWVAAQRSAGVEEDMTIRTYADRERVSFLVLGDTGEGDASQYSVVPGLLNTAEGTAFLCIASDVIYPAGGAGEYEAKFYRPYQDYPAPIYAVPGNHDWYDGLQGFMLHFCGAGGPTVGDTLGDTDADTDSQAVGDAPGDSYDGWLPRTGGSLVRRLLLRWLWREAPPADEAELERMRALRDRPEQRAYQPGPYFALDAGPVLLVGIDTGITDHIDAEQGAWLERVSKSSPKPKILLTGTPLYANGEHWPVRIEGRDTTVDDIVRAAGHNYVAAIGGDQHNYQRYPVDVGGGRVIQYIVSGGGGAFLHDTHLIPRVDLPGVDERGFRCYPMRGDSLSMLSQTYERRLGWLLGKVFIPPGQAAALMAEQLGAPPTRREDRGVTITDEARRAFRKIVRLPKRFPGPLQEYVQRFFDRNVPPLFKSFLRIDASADEIAIRCFAATGCRAHELTPPVEDVVRCVRDSRGAWHAG